MKKGLTIFLFLLIFLVVLSACTPKSFYNSPAGQPLSRWASEDGRVHFFNESAGFPTGTITTESGTEEIALYILAPFGEISVFPIELLDKDGEAHYDRVDKLEKWSADFSCDDHFDVTVIESTYFTPGETFTIYRTVKGLSDGEYIASHAWYAHSPSEQPFTRWTDEGGRIELRVDNACTTVGTIQTDDGLVEVVWNIFIRDGDITLYPIESLGEDGKIDRDLYPPLEKWDTDFQWFDDHFEVTVAQSTYFTPGETFTIYRMEEGVPLNEHSP